MKKRMSNQNSSCRNFPKDWIKELKDICDIKHKYKSLNPQKFKEKIFEHYSIPAYQNNMIPSLEKGQDILSQKQVIQNNTVLFGKLNPRVEKVWLVKGHSKYKKIASTEWIAISPHKGVCIDFIYYVMWSNFVMPYAKSLTSGSTPSRQRIDPKQFFKINIPVPPLSEQKKIAAILSKIQQAIEAKSKLIKITQELQEMATQYLFTLGSKRENTKKTIIGEVPKSWEIYTLKEICEIKGGKRVPKGEEFSQEKTPYSYIRVTDFENMTVNLENIKFVSKSIHDRIKRYVISKDDLYISVAGTLGLVGSIPEGLNGAHLTENANKIIIKDKKKSSKEFLKFYLNGASIQKQVKEEKGSGGGVSKLALGKIENFKLPLPKINEQEEISTTLQRIDDSINNYKNQRKILSELFKTMLDKLMTGEIRVNNLKIDISKIG